MTCLEFLENVDAFALRALEPPEMASCAAHLTASVPHQGCPEDYQRAVATIVQLSVSATPVRPSPEVWRRIESQIASPGSVARTHRREAIAWITAVAAAVAFVVSWIQHDADRRAQSQLENRLTAAQAELTASEQCKKDLEAMRQASGGQVEVFALLDRPGTRVVSLEAQGGRAGRASAVFNASEKRAILVATALPRPPGKDFELWIIKGKEPPMPAGLVQVGPNGMIVAEFDRAKLGSVTPDAFALSIEPKGGSATPTDVLLVGKLSG